MLLPDALLILFLVGSETINAPTALPGLPYSVSSSSSNVMDSVQAVPVLCEEQSFTTLAPRSGVLLAGSPGTQLPAHPVSWSHRRHVLVTFWLPAQQLLVAYRQTWTCFAGTMAPWIRSHFTFAGHSAIPIRAHYVSIPTTITACSPFSPRRHHPCQSQRAIRFQDAT